RGGSEEGHARTGPPDEKRLKTRLRKLSNDCVTDLYARLPQPPSSPVVHAAVPTCRIVALVAAAMLIFAAPAAAAPPPNDSPATPDSFQPHTAENGQPSDLEAIAELAEATPDRGVPRWLGPAPFARTV